MPPRLALLVYLLFVVGLFRQARSGRDWSRELWLPLVWILIIGTKTPAEWMALFTQTARDPEGSPIDTAILIGLLLLGLRVLAKKRTNWNRVIAQNKWLFLYFGYVGLSVLWSDKPFGSFKLWVKDAGNLIMVMVILSKQSVFDATKSTLLRASYVLVPLSVLLVKYFPEIGRGYDKWTYQPIILGASDSKNNLGATILLCLLTLLFHVFNREPRKAGKLAVAMQYLLLLMALWLLLHANCATAVAGTIIGALVYLVMMGDSGQGQGLKAVRIVIIFALILMLVLHFTFDLGQMVAGALGRDMTLTGRTDIWSTAYGASGNPLIGAGYSGFWVGQRAHSISEKLGFFFDLKEAHNGFLETYLNVGIIGILLLTLALVTGTAKILHRHSEDVSYQRRRFVCIIVALVYNTSESAFAGLNLIWFSMLLMLFDFPTPQLDATTESKFSSKKRASTRGQIMETAYQNRDTSDRTTSLLLEGI